MSVYRSFLCFSSGWIVDLSSFMFSSCCLQESPLTSNVSSLRASSSRMDALWPTTTSRRVSLPWWIGGFNILIVVGLSNGGLQCWHALRKEVEHNFEVPIDSEDEEMLLLPVSSYSDMELRLMQSQPCTWYCACGEESLNHHWWLWQGNTTRRRWFVASKFSSFNPYCLSVYFGEFNFLQS